MPKEKPIIIESKTCHVCDFQNKVLEKSHMKDKFRVVYVENKNSEAILKKAKLKGHDIQGTPTFFCSNLECKEEGMKGPKLLKSFLKRANSMSPSAHFQKKSWSWYFALIPLIIIEVFVLMFIVFLPL